METREITNSALQDLVDSGQAKLSDGLSLQNLAHKVIIHFIVQAGVMLITAVFSSSSSSDEDQDPYVDVDPVTDRIFGGIW